jgi:hypothetical protein
MFTILLTSDLFTVDTSQRFFNELFSDVETAMYRAAEPILFSFDKLFNNNDISLQ